MSQSQQGSPSSPPEGAIAIVSPRYGEEVVGGAEDVLADLAHGLQARGHAVELLTTCAADHFTWANKYPEGRFVDGELTVRRFRTQIDTPGHNRDRIGARLLAGDAITVQDQQLWVNDSLRCSGMWHHVFDHGHRYRSIIFAPYMFWTTYAVSQIHPRRSLIMPCLHDEPAAGLDIFAAMIEGAGGLLFLTEPERELAQRLYRLPARNTIIGASVDIADSYDPESFRRSYNIEGDYVYFAGRREWGKGWDDLKNAYGVYLQQRGGRRALRLVTSGVGEVIAPLGAESQVLDVGLLSNAQRDNAMAGAAAYVQPSAMESFSRTVLEAMAAGTPVLANGHSDVVSWHLDRSQAGLTYTSGSELVQALHFVTDEPEAAASLAQGGRDYVLANYRLDPVLDRLSIALDNWFPTPTSATHERPLEGVR